MKKNQYVGFPIKLVQSYFKQILIAINFMHQNNVTHTDLKPENILYKGQTLKKIYIPKSKLPSQKLKASSSTVRKEDLNDQEQMQKLYLPESDEIRIIDMGGATFDLEHHSSVINTRQYRAPEVILNCIKWNSSSDIWCIACIILELYTELGELYYQTRKSDIEHLAMIERSCGAIPRWMIEKSNQGIRKEFILNDQFLMQNKSYMLHAPQEKINKMRTMDDIIQEDSLKRLLKQMMMIDPGKRINCEEALKHEFFNEDF